MTRRELLVSTALQAPLARALKDDRPNILFAIADDWGWPHASVYGDRVVGTPTFDRVCREGAVFTQAHCCASTCSPSRAAILTGQTIHRLAEGGNIFGFLPKRFAVYPDLLEAAGYQVGYERKGWGPGRLGERTRNPAGPQYKRFQDFLAKLPAGQPFCYWFGSFDPHRPYKRGTGLESGMRPEDVRVPPFLPDTPEVRSDFLDYYWKTQRFDREVGEIVDMVERAGRLDNTIVVITGDNGCSFPRAKANCYDYGTHQPLAIRWPARVKAGRRISEFVSLTDMAPTFLEAAGLKPLPEMTGRSFLGLLTGAGADKRDHIFMERERHDNCRPGNGSYPMRAIRTRDFLYIRNLRPDRWPAGNPPYFDDVDDCPTKELMLARRDDPKFAPYFQWSFGKRPAEELYDLRKDPGELSNVAAESRYASTKARLRRDLDGWMKRTEDPRATNDDDRWDLYEYFGPKNKFP
jgi:uncharacterized sulfatase